MIRWVDLVRHDCNGYELVTDPDVAHGRGASITHHRLIAFGRGELDELDEEIEIDHLDGVPWLNYAAGLEAVGPIEHGRRTRRRERARKSRV